MQDAIAHRAVRIDRGAPGVGRAQQVEPRIGRDQFHHRSRIERDVGAVAQSRRRLALGVDHEQADRIERDARAGPGGGHFGRQRLGQHQAAPEGHESAQQSVQ